MYVCMHEHSYMFLLGIQMYVCMYACMHKNYMHIHVELRYGDVLDKVEVCMYVCMNIHKCSFLESRCMYVCMYLCILNIYIYIYIYIYSC
jgi:hypothetical protein